MPAKKSLTLKIFFFLVFTDLLETFAQFCFKKGAISANIAPVDNIAQAGIFISAVIFSPFLWLALFSVLAIFIIWSSILSKVDLSVAVPVASFSYITIPIVSAVFLHEKISILRWSGIALIVAGVLLVSVSTRRKEAAV